MADAIVLDASAIFALLYREPGAEAVVKALADNTKIVHISTVNMCEIVTKLVQRGASKSQVADSIQPFLPYLIDFDLDQARYAGELSQWTRLLGLSLGDRACLALARSRKATAWTTDTAWSKLETEVQVKLLRG